MARATKKATPTKSTRSRAAVGGRAKPAKGGASRSAKPAAKAKPVKKVAAKRATKPAAKSKKTQSLKAKPVKAAPKRAVAKKAAPKKAVPKKAVPKKVPATRGKQVTSAAKAGKTQAKAPEAPPKGPGRTVAAKAVAPAPDKKAGRRKESETTVEAIARKPKKPELTPKEIQAIRKQLEEQRDNYLREYNELEEGAFTISQSEMSGEVSFDEEYADAGSFTFEREKELSIGNNIRDLLDRANQALGAIDSGTYGLCENCGNPINKARLMALPSSTLCIDCKQMEERTR